MDALAVVYAQELMRWGIEGSVRTHATKVGLVT
jgi:hypothetical protein